MSEPTISDTIRAMIAENKLLKARTERLEKALEEISTHLDPLRTAVKNSWGYARDDGDLDNASYWNHELKAHDANCQLIKAVLEEGKPKPSLAHPDYLKTTNT